MANPANDDIRKLFTEIGCIMEDASIVAFIWSDGDGFDVPARLKSLSNANAEIGDRITQIEKGC